MRSCVARLRFHPKKCAGRAREGARRGLLKEYTRNNVIGWLFYYTSGDFEREADLFGIIGEGRE